MFFTFDEYLSWLLVLKDDYVMLIIGKKKFGTWNKHSAIVVRLQLYKLVFAPLAVFKRTGGLIENF